MSCIPKTVFCIAVIGLQFFCALSFAEEPIDEKTLQGHEFFENKIRPVLVAKCYSCHSQKSKIVRGGLLLDSRANVIKGGDSGPSVVPGKIKESILIDSLKYEASEMPPEGKLPESVIKDFEKWVEMGLPDPRDGKAVAVHSKINIEEGKKFWSFQPVKKHLPPKVNHQAWPKNGIDNFILSKIEEKKLSPSEDAEKRVLIRRLYFDLIGLPPTPKQIDAVMGDSSDEAIEKLVDELLASPRFGEHWGRHWLDIARYSQSTGGGRSLLFKTAWRYRNYVIDSFNKDKPYNEFIREQIAGDLIAESDAMKKRENQIATAFLAIGPTNYEAQNKNQLIMDVIDEQIQTVGKAFLGMTLGCARCHDHKFDPIPTDDYYALAGIFKSTKTLGNLGNVASWYRQTLPLSPKEQVLVDSIKEEIASTVTSIEQVDQKIDQHKAKMSLHVVDDHEAEAIGKWEASQYFKTYYGKEYKVSKDSVGRMIYRFEGIKNGTYDVQVSYTHGPGRNKKTVYRVKNFDGVTTHHVDQSSEPNIDNLFVSIGQFQFDSKVGATVTLYTNQKKGYVIADAVRLIRIVKKDTEVDDGKILTEIAALKKEKSKFERTKKKLDKKLQGSMPTAVAVTEEKTIGDIPRLIRGELTNIGKVVPRGFVSVAISDPAPKFNDKVSGRLELAEWIIQEKNPLTARVAVNRIWHHLFAKGIVRTVDNFGIRGQKPSHPKLLDYLATRLIENQWSTKSMIREIVLSRTYQLASSATDVQRTKDTENRLFSHQRRRRLNAESLRDSVLYLSGDLELKRWDQTIRPGTGLGYGYKFDENTRSVYLPIFRNRLHDFLAAFDFPDPNLSVGKRSRSIISTQSLYLMNSPFILDQAEKMADKILASDAATDEEKLNQWFLTALGRTPHAEEATEILNSISRLKKARANERQVWTAICQTVVSCLDFRFVH